MAVWERLADRIQIATVVRAGMAVRPGTRHHGMQQQMSDCLSLP